MPSIRSWPGMVANGGIIDTRGMTLNVKDSSGKIVTLPILETPKKYTVVDISAWTAESKTKAMQVVMRH